MIALTFDIELAPDAVLADTLKLVAESGVPVTLFATHASTGAGARVFLKRLLNQIRTGAIPTTLLRDVAARMPEGAAS